MKKLLILLFVFPVLYANSQDWIAYKRTKINVNDNKVIDTLHVRIDSIKTKPDQLNHKIYFYDKHGNPDNIVIDEVVSYRMNNIIHTIVKYTVVYKDKFVVLTNDIAPAYNNVAFIIDNLTGTKIDKNGKSDFTDKVTSDTVKEMQNQTTGNNIDFISTKLNKLESSVNEINLHLDQHRKEFTYGMICNIAGIGCSVAGVMLIMNARNNNRGNNFNNSNTTFGHNGHHGSGSTLSSGTGYAVSGLGVGMSIIGCLITIDSEKWFSKKHNHSK